MPRPEPPSMGWSELIHRLAMILRYKWWDLKQWVRPERHQYISEMEEPEAQQPAGVGIYGARQMLGNERRWVRSGGVWKTVVIVCLLAGIGYYELRAPSPAPGMGGGFSTLSRRKTYTREVFTAQDLNRDQNTYAKGITRITADSLMWGGGGRYIRVKVVQAGADTPFVTGAMVRRWR